MQYRVCKASGEKISALGFGCMRLPVVSNEAEKMVLAAVDGGVNFFDTAYIYPNSEKTLGAVLSKNNLRKKIFIATKMPISMCKKPGDFDKFFEIQLNRLQTDFIDYYFMHNISNFAQWEMMQRLGVEKWLAEKKASGAIKHAGFSYHGSGEEFPKVLNSYPWEVCMIQYNYYDENYQAGKKGLLYAAEKNISVMVMEPLLGGRLATGLPKKAEEIFRRADEKKSPADWALRWVWNHKEVTCVLSGMSTEKQTAANISAAKNFSPLTPGESRVYNEVTEIFKKSFKIKCTGCNYCLPCPKGIDIPARFSAYNTSFSQNFFTGVFLYMTGMGAMSQNPISVHNCNACGKCEKNCPQNIKIRAELKKVGKRFESLPFRATVRILRFFLR